jgi:hypothetical protein
MGKKMPTTIVIHPRPTAIPGRGEPRSVRDAYDAHLAARPETAAEPEREAEAS